MLSLFQNFNSLENVKQSFTGSEIFTLALAALLHFRLCLYYVTISIDSFWLSTIFENFRSYLPKRTPANVALT